MHGSCPALQGNSFVLVAGTSGVTLECEGLNPGEDKVLK